MTIPISDEARAHLTEEELERLTWYKWRYILQADGFSEAVARRLCFARWLFLKGRLCE